MGEVTSVDMTCGAAPLQYEGRIDDGRWFYFRSRGTVCSLGVGDSLDEAVDDPNAVEIGLLEWELDPYCFSGMPDEVGRALIPWLLGIREYIAERSAS